MYLIFPVSSCFADKSYEGRTDPGPGHHGTPGGRPSLPFFPRTYCKSEWPTVPGFLRVGGGGEGGTVPAGLRGGPALKHWARIRCAYGAGLGVARLRSQVGGLGIHRSPSARDRWHPVGVLGWSMGDTQVLRLACGSLRMTHLSYASRRRTHLSFGSRRRTHLSYGWFRPGLF